MIKRMGFVLLCLTAATVPSQCFAGASGHAGQHGGGAGGAGKGCPRIVVSDNEPAALAEVAPGSTFTVAVTGTKNADDIEVTIKKIPVAITAISKERFMEVEGKIPAELRGIPARVIVKVKSQYPGCDQESGWLYKITK
jgi:hypothetical protein